MTNKFKKFIIKQINETKKACNELNDSLKAKSLVPEYGVLGKIRAHEIWIEILERQLKGD